MGNFAWIELVFFYGIAIGFGLWQWLKMKREVKAARAEREAREAREQGEDITGAETDAD